MTRKTKRQTKKVSHGKCTFCDEPAVFPRSQLCGACYQYIWYYMRKTPTAVVQRMRKLKLYESRLSSLSSVRVIQPKRRRA